MTDNVVADSPEAGNDQAGGNDGQIKVAVEGEEKVFSAEDVLNLVKQRAAVTQRSQAVAPLLRVLDKYGIDAETYTTQAEGALAVVGRLIEQGIIDEQGNVIEKKQVDQTKSSPGEFGGFDVGGRSSEEKTMKIVEAALGKYLGPIAKRLEAMEEDQLALLRESTSNRIRAIYPHFSEQNVSELFARAAKDSKMSLLEHAKLFDKELADRNEALEATIAKKYGLDLGELRNKLKEQSAEGGAMAAFEGKKFSFRNVAARRDKGGKSVSPLDATMDYFRKLKG